MNDTDTTVWQITGDIRRRYDKLLKHTTSITKATQKELVRIDPNWKKKLEALVVLARSIAGVDAWVRQNYNSSDLRVYLAITDIDDVTELVRPRQIELKDVILATKLSLVVSYKGATRNFGQLRIANDGAFRFRGERFHHAHHAISFIRSELEMAGVVTELMSKDKESQE